ncbi:hypothetical protein JCM11641_001151 [Rhodosporidiobolus odoratus]
MIPARPVRSEAPTVEGVSSRLNRLRLEQRERPSFRSILAPSPANNAPRWLTAALNPVAAQPVVRRAYGRRGIAGPPAPPSWTAPVVSVDPALAVDGRNRQGTWTQPIEMVERKKLATPLQETSRVEEGPASLFSVAGGVVAIDLARGPEDSLLLEHVAYLPNHLRLRLLDVFADWRSAAPLTSEGAIELLRTDVNEGYERDEDEENPRSIEDEELDWEQDGLLGEGISLETLTDLNFSFSEISLRALRSILLHPMPQSSASRTPTPTSGISVLPQTLQFLPTFSLLRRLNLTSTPRIQFSDPFFDLLASLISLCTLSLCDKSIDTPNSTVTSSTFLPRLAIATPTLVTLDLSYIDFEHVAVKAVDWDVRWQHLKVLGVRRELVDWKGCEVGKEKRERVKREVWQFISQGRQKKRRWIEIIV